MLNSILNRALKFSLESEEHVKIHLVNNYVTESMFWFYILDPAQLWKDKNIPSAVIFWMVVIFSYVFCLNSLC